MDKKLEQLFYAALGGALAVKEKIETNSDEFKAKRKRNSLRAFSKISSRKWSPN
jgi:hypothetical protein